MSAVTQLNALFTTLKVTGSLHGRRQFHRWVAPVCKTFYNRRDKVKYSPNPRNTYPEWNYDVEIYAFGQRLGENFDKDILKQALLDRSYADLQKQQQEEVGIEPDLELPTNSEMSAKGDQLINLYVEHYLSTTLNRVPQKYLRNIRHYLVREEQIGYIAKELGMSDLIMSSDYPVDQEMLARGFRSVIQALSESSGEDRACSLVRDLVVTQLVGVDLTAFCTPEDPMAELEEHLKTNGLPPPEPRLISAIGQHSILASYDVGMYSNKQMIGRGHGESAETAQNMAACDALWRAWNLRLNRKPLPFNLELPPLEKFSVSAARSSV